MAFPRRLLSEDEDVVLDLHPHWKRLVGPALLVPVLAGAASYAVFAMPDGRFHTAGQIAVVVVAALLLVAFSITPFLKWRTTNYVVTTRRVVIRQGVLGRSGRDVPLSRVNDVSFQHSLFERMLGCGTLLVESAGERGQISLPEVPRVEAVQREIYRLVEAEDARRRGVQAHVEE